MVSSIFLFVKLCFGIIFQVSDLCKPSHNLDNVQDFDLYVYFALPVFEYRLEMNNTQIIMENNGHNLKTS